MLRRFVGLTLAIMLAQLIGCAAAGGGGGSGGIKVEGSSTSALVDLPTPTVAMHGDTLVVSGIVRRKSGVDGPVPGYVSVMFLKQDRQWIDGLPATWTPQPIPTTGQRESHYLIRYGWNPPAGTIVRVEYSENPLLGYTIGGGTAPAPGAGSGAGFAGGMPASGVAGGSYYTQTRGTLGTPGQMGTPGTPPGGGSK